MQYNREFFTIFRFTVYRSTIWNIDNNCSANIKKRVFTIFFFFVFDTKSFVKLEKYNEKYVQMIQFWQCLKKVSDRNHIQLVISINTFDKQQQDQH